MAITIKSEEKRVVCVLSRRLDTNMTYELDPEIDKATQPGKHLIFDFEQVDYISSSFLRICIKKYKELGAGNFYIQNPKPDIKKVFKIAGLEQLIKE